MWSPNLDQNKDKNVQLPLPIIVPLSEGCDICKYQYRYYIDIFFMTILIYRYDIDISPTLKTTLSIFNEVHCYQRT